MKIAQFLSFWQESIKFWSSWVLDTGLTGYNLCVVLYADTLPMNVGCSTEKLIALSAGLHGITTQKKLFF